MNVYLLTVLCGENVMQFYVVAESEEEAKLRASSYGCIALNAVKVGPQ